MKQTQSRPTAWEGSKKFWLFRGEFDSEDAAFECGTIRQGDVIRTLRDPIAPIGHLHTAGNPGRHDLDETQERYYPAIMRAIAALEYDGYIGQELMPKDDPLAALEQAFKVSPHLLQTALSQRARRLPLPDCGYCCGF